MRTAGMRVVITDDVPELLVGDVRMVRRAPDRPAEVIRAIW